MIKSNLLFYRIITVSQVGKRIKFISFSNLLIILLAILFLPSIVKSNDLAFIEDNHKNRYGLKASNISGYGVFYNRRLSQNYYFQANGLIYYLDYELGDKETTTAIFNYDLGVEIQRNIINSASFRFYFLAGAYYFFDDETNISTIDNNSNSETTKEEIYTHSYNIGLGVGVEYYFYKRAFVLAELGYKFYEDKIKTLYDGEEPLESPELIRVTKIGASIGVGYTF